MRGAIVRRAAGSRPRKGDSRAHSYPAARRDAYSEIHRSLRAGMSAASAGPTTDIHTSAPAPATTFSVLASRALTPRPIKPHPRRHDDERGGGRRLVPKSH